MKTAGFTLLELIVVIILIGVLAVTAYSRFQGKDGVVEYAYQARLVSALRNMQTRAMQDTRPGYCFLINLNAGDFGPPSLAYDTTTGNPPLTCGTSIDFSTPDYLRTDAGELTGEGLVLLAPVNHVGFDDMGRPVDNSGASICQNQCQLTIQGSVSVPVCIETEGYIHAASC
ncbi:prepilin-type N-terminal cleavage/methylation domain-containing protein [Bowmanella dokdonensis]